MRWLRLTVPTTISQHSPSSQLKSVSGLRNSPIGPTTRTVTSSRWRISRSSSVWNPRFPPTYHPLPTPLQARVRHLQDSSRTICICNFRCSTKCLAAAWSSIASLCWPMRPCRQITPHSRLRSVCHLSDQPDWPIAHLILIFECDWSFFG